VNKTIASYHIYSFVCIVAVAPKKEHFYSNIALFGVAAVLRAKIT